MTTRDERRRFSRIAFHRPAELEVRGHRTSCDLLDVSLKGALVEVPAGFEHPVGTGCSLSIHLDAGAAIGRQPFLPEIGGQGFEADGLGGERGAQPLELRLVGDAHRHDGAGNRAPRVG